MNEGNLSPPKVPSIHRQKVVFWSLSCLSERFWSFYFLFITFLFGAVSLGFGLEKCLFHFPSAHIHFHDQLFFVCPLFCRTNLSSSSSSSYSSSFVTIVLNTNTYRQSPFEIEQLRQTTTIEFRFEQRLPALYTFTEWLVRDRRFFVVNKRGKCNGHSGKVEKMLSHLLCSYKLKLIINY